MNDTLPRIFFNEVVTRDMGLANVLAAVQAGITRFDGSLGGRACDLHPAPAGSTSCAARSREPRRNPHPDPLPQAGRGGKTAP